MKTIRLLLLSMLTMTTSLAATTAATTQAQPDSAGFSAARLQRLTDKFEGDVRSGIIPGAVVLIVRNGRVAYFKTFGERDKAANAPMQADSIFRIASMTKQIGRAHV